VFLGGGWFNDGWYEPHITSCSLFLYDLTHCIRYQLTPDWWKISWYWDLDLASNALVIAAATHSLSVHNDGDLYYISLDDWQIVQLTNSPEENDETPVFNGRYVAWIKEYHADNINQDHDLGFWLLDTDTMEATMLAEPNMASTDYQINDRYVVWKAWGDGQPDSYGRDIFFYDLQTGQKGHVPASAPGWAYQVDVGSHWIAWMDSARENSPPYRIWIYDIDTGEATMLSEEPDFFGFNLDHQLLVWDTYAYCGNECYHLDTDLEAYDVRTGLRRRLTTRQYPWGSGPGHMNLPWLLVGVGAYGPPYPQGVFLLNLEKLGVVDQDGNLLPGDPTIEPPPDP